MQIVYIYNDQGVSQESLLHTITSLKQSLPASYLIKYINACEVIANHWSKDAALFIMPGGADLLYVKKLKGIGNLNIKNYVQAGGAYLGICAGAYYACGEVEFDKNGPLEVLGKRELAFFTEKAIGPILASYSYDEYSGARAANVQVKLNNINSLKVFYNGGCYFAKHYNNSETLVIAYYDNQLPAIISMDYGQGKVILSGVHIEYVPSLLDATNPYLVKIIPELNSYRSLQILLWHKVLGILKLKF
jgi:biotin--protein ligase